jgi:hypothetical protein
LKTIIEVIPLVGIKWDDKIISLMDSRQTIENVLGKPYATHKNAYYYFDNQLRFDFNDMNAIEFIEFLGGIDGDIQPKIYGVIVFEVKADELYDVLMNRNNGVIDDHEGGDSYSFLNTSVGIYRPTKPEDIIEMLKESEKVGIEPDLEHEIRNAAHWHTIGIGVPGYYDRIASINFNAKISA